MRGSWLAAGGALTLAAGCLVGSAFACTEDSDCTLSGVPGVCQPTGACSYPDAECPSGFRYPLGAPGSLGGECVGGGGSADSSATEGPPTGSDDSASDPSEGGEQSADGDSTVTNPTLSTSASTTGSVDDSGPASDSSSDGGPACLQEDSEPNDELNDAVELSGSDCRFVASGAIGGADDVDVYKPDMTLCNDIEMHFDIDPLDNLQRCIVFKCTGPMGPSILCGGGSTSSDGEWWECCGSQDFDATIGCDGEPPQMYLVVEGPTVCSDYDLTFEPAL